MFNLAQPVNKGLAQFQEQLKLPTQKTQLRESYLVAMVEQLSLCKMLNGSSADDPNSSKDQATFENQLFPSTLKARAQITRDLEFWTSHRISINDLDEHAILASNRIEEAKQRIAKDKHVSA